MDLRSAVRPCFHPRVQHCERDLWDPLARSRTAPFIVLRGGGQGHLRETQYERSNSRGPASPRSAATEHERVLLLALVLCASLPHHVNDVDAAREDLNAA